MSDDYLWDKSGKPDPEIEKLEKTLGQLRYTPRATAAPMSQRRPRMVYGLALAATFVLAIGMSTWLTLRKTPVVPKPVASVAASGFDVARLDGAPRVGNQSFAEKGKLPVGAWLETDGASRAKITIADIGHVEVAPDSKIRLVSTSKELHRLDLDHGTVFAKVNAPPRLFVIDTVAATAVDLGCAYSLSVDPKSTEGTLKVTSGWVSLEAKGRASLVPAGAVCHTRPSIGPGTPYFADATQTLRDALHRFDFESDVAALTSILSESRVRDLLTLWHLLSRVEAARRDEVYARMIALKPPPSGASKEKVLSLDRAALETWWTQLEATW